MHPDMFGIGMAGSINKLAIGSFLISELIKYTVISEYAIITNIK